MILIPVNSVRSFCHKAAKIQSNKVLPVCDYIHIQYSKGSCTFSKTNNYAFVIEEMDAEGKENQDYMILEKDLSAFVEHNSGILAIKKVKDKLVLVDDRSTAPCLTTEDKFPPLEVPENNAIELSPLVIKNIKTASKMLATEQTPTWRSHVFVGKKMVIGCDGFVAFSIPCDIEDKIIFRKEAISALPDIGAVYKQNSSYDFFECGRTLYGFIKSETGFFDMTAGMTAPNVDSFEVKRGDLVSFNEWVLDIAVKPEFASIEWNFVDNELALVGSDSFSEKSVERKIKATGGEYFKYLPTQMNKILKAIDDDVLTCYKGPKNVCITNEKQTFISLLQQIV
jgi:hypothetical protein